MASRAVGPLRSVVVGLAASLIAGAVACANPDPPATPSAPPLPLPLITKDEAPPYCQFRGAVSSRQKSDHAYADLQQQGAVRGATHIVLDGTRSYGGGRVGGWGGRIGSELFGRAFWCPPPPGYAPYAGPAPGASPPAAAFSPAVLPASAAQPAKGESCSPACQAGYACVARACIPVCDPPCAAGQVCSTDRVCRSP